jgi:hypothetical protein
MFPLLSRPVVVPARNSITLPEYGKVPATDTISWSFNVTLSGANMNKSSEHEDEMCIETEEKED